MEKVTVKDWDPAEYIETKEDVIACLEAALEENDPEFLLSTIGDIARSKGMTQIAQELNLNREGLYKSFLPLNNQFQYPVPERLGDSDSEVPEGEAVPFPGYAA
ncbi:putative addiction module antidote protein [Treponema primitia]|uniref:addiction module antidote protein n=1 Tax=Treponema primitia TaxID=88058 RepID=UPI00397F83A8